MHYLAGTWLKVDPVNIYGIVDILKLKAYNRSHSLVEMRRARHYYWERCRNIMFQWLEIT